MIWKNYARFEKNAIQSLHFEHELSIKENKKQTCRIHWKKLQVDGCKANYGTFSTVVTTSFIETYRAIKEQFNTCGCNT